VSFTLNVNIANAIMVNVVAPDVTVALKRFDKGCKKLAPIRFKLERRLNRFYKDGFE
jgi:hypothetical protein